MLTPEERAEIEAEFPHYPNRKAVCIDAMKIVQKHRGWLSDDALKDIGELLGMSVADLDGVATFYNLLFRRPVGRHVIYLLRQRELLDHGRGTAMQPSQEAAGSRGGRNDSRWAIHPASGGVPGRVRPRAGHDD